MSGEATVIEITEDGGDATIVEGVIVDGAGAAGGASTTGALAPDDPLLGIEEMRRKLAEKDEQVRFANENAARQQQQTADAERRAREAQNEAARVAALNDEGQYQQIVGALAANESQLDGLQQQKALALEAGDYTKSAAIDAQMGKVTARIVSLENGKTHLDEQRKNAPRFDPAQHQQLSQAEQNEQFLSRLAPKAQGWIRQHPEFFTDPGFQARVMAAAQHAEQIRGLKPHDDAYYDAIETDLGMKQAPQQQQQEPTRLAAEAPAGTVANPTSTAAAAAPRHSPQVSAAPSRSLPEGSGGREPPRKIVLSPEQRQIAHMNEPDKTPREAEVIYAKNLYALQKEGKIAY